MPARRYRCTWNDIASLDCDYMAGWGAFEPDCSTTIEFDDAEPSQLAFRMDSGGRAFTVVYKRPTRSRGDNGDFVQATIDLEDRPCRFGGSRRYFICPCCGRRVLRLAVLPQGLRCGACGRVTWGSRRERPLQRLMRKADKISIELGCESWREIPLKRPPHMRVATFERLRMQRAELVADINRQIGVRLATKRGHLLQQMVSLVKLGV